MKIHWNLQQGSAAWYQMRAGIPTASEFSKIISPKRMEPAAARFPYACRLIAGRLLHWQAESLDRVQHVLDGKELEPLAVRSLELLHEVETVPVGFITTDDGRFGASPDRLIGVKPLEQPASIPGTLEVKCPTIPRQFEYLLLGHDDAYRCQVQGQLFVAEADKALFFSYCPRTPPYVFETGRDELFIRKLEDALEQFSDELERLMERAISLGTYEAFEAIQTPEEAERADMLRREELAGIIEGTDGRKYAWGA